MRYRNRWIAACKVLLIFLLTSCAGGETKIISIVETTDIHGVILPWDYIEDLPLDASLASTAGFIKKLRSERVQVILLDNGDNLQGQPAVYYYNFIDTVSTHLLAESFNYLDYDACTVGNHDIEAGHAVYDRIKKEYRFPVLAANAVDTKTGEPYFKPYTMIERDNIRIAVMGLVTPAIPTWLPEELYSGIEFRDMVETAEKWMPEILSQRPDIVVGLFHAGWNTENEEYKLDDSMNENGSSAVAWKVPGFDIIFCGHDHRPANEKFVNSNGDTVLILNGGSRSELVARADIRLRPGRNNAEIISMDGELVAMKNFPPDKEFVEKFSSSDRIIKDYVNRVIGDSPASVSSRDSYFGPPSFTGLIHKIQFQITGADVSFAAPLSFDVEIPEGPVRVRDMFKLYRYENMLYTMSLTGEEILKYLEYSYSAWIRTMKDPSDFLLNYRVGNDGKPSLTNGKAWLANPSYNFDSGAGINYYVDVSKPEGERVKITSFTDGRPFDVKQSYKVALNSYRGNGGGGHLTRGAGIRQEDLRSRMISSTEKDLRYYFLRYFEDKGTLDTQTPDNWKFIPESWIKIRVPKEYLLLFGQTIQ